MKIWGNERDLFEGTLGWKATLQNWAYNRWFEQCWHLPEAQIRKIRRDIDRWKPRLLWCYRDGIDAVAKYVVERSLRPYAPAAIVLGGATVYPYMAQVIERAFHSPAIGAYGSREVGTVACQCLERAGHHIATHANVVETNDVAGRPVVGAGNGTRLRLAMSSLLLIANLGRGMLSFSRMLLDRTIRQPTDRLNSR